MVHRLPIAALAAALVMASATASAAPAPPLGLTTTASGATVTIAWAAPAAGEAPTSYLLEAGSAQGASDIAAVNTGSAATTFITTLEG